MAGSGAPGLPISGIKESLCGVFLDSLDGKPQAGRLHAADAGAHEGAHIGLRYPVPDHGPRIAVSAFAHRLAQPIVVHVPDTACASWQYGVM